MSNSSAGRPPAPFQTSARLSSTYRAYAFPADGHGASSGTAPIGPIRRRTAVCRGMGAVVGGVDVTRRQSADRTGFPEADGVARAGGCLGVAADEVVGSVTSSARPGRRRRRQEAGCPGRCVDRGLRRWRRRSRVVTSSARGRSMTTSIYPGIWDRARVRRVAS